MTETRRFSACASENGPYQAIRAKEMMEARVDAVFDSLREDPAFVALTAGADGKLPIPMKGMNGSRENR